MDVMQAIYGRRSVRAYTGEAVPRETLEALMQAAVQAPTAVNLQPWAFAVIEGVERLRGYSDRTKAHLLAHLAEMPFLEGYREFFLDADSNLFYGAPAMILIFAQPGGVAPDFDCAMAAQNLMLAAYERGLGTCWIGFFAFLLSQPEVLQELGVPEDYRVIAPIIVGRPTSPAEPVEKAPPQVIFWQE